MSESLACDSLYTTRVHLNKDSVAINDLVIIEILEQGEKKQMRGGIHLPDQAVINCEAIKGKVISVGPEVLENLNVGDVVLYDKHSAFFHPPEIPGTFIITKVENVICLYND